MKQRQLIVAAVITCAVSVGSTRAQSPVDDGLLEVTWQTCDGGGGTSGGGTFEVTGTIGQPDAGTAMTGGTFSVSGGFWPGAIEPIPQCSGDANRNGAVTIDDLVAVITSWGMCPTPCPPTCAGDVTNNCQVGIDDLVLVITHWGLCP